MFTRSGHWPFVVWSPLTQSIGPISHQIRINLPNSVTKLSFFWNGLLFYKRICAVRCRLSSVFYHVHTSCIPANVFDTLSLFAFVSSIHFCRCRRPLSSVVAIVVLCSLFISSFFFWFGVRCLSKFSRLFSTSGTICILYVTVCVFYRLTARIYSFKQFYSFHFRCMAACILFHFIFSCCSFAGAWSFSYSIPIL